MARQQGERGCASTFLGCFAAGVLILVVIGVAAYFFVPKCLKDADNKVVPWLESKGRVLVGKMALQPLIKTIERSELSRSEKKEWSDFLVEKWELASSSQDQKLRRETLINASRETVGTYSGMYYALLAIGERDFKETSLTGKQIEMGQKLITAITAHMLDGNYSLDELAPLRSDLYSVLTGWREETQNEQGQREQDNNLRDFFRSLLRLTEKPEHHGDNQSHDMDVEFRKELLAFKQRVVQEEQQMKEESELAPGPVPSKAAADGGLSGSQRRSKGAAAHRRFA
jgi:hypothetical protein